MKRLSIATSILLVASLSDATPPKKVGAIAWQPWSDAAFEQAKREKKFILLDLEAVSCHHCHVMYKTTHKTPEVRALIQSKYIPSRVDHDSGPHFSHRSA